MATYDITQACGHVKPIVVPDYRKPSDIDASVRYYESQPCSDCFRDSYPERVKAARTHQARHELPNFVDGSPRQKDFARVIRMGAWEALGAANCHESLIDVYRDALLINTDTRYWLNRAKLKGDAWLNEAVRLVTRSRAMRGDGGDSAR